MRSENHTPRPIALIDTPHYSKGSYIAGSKGVRLLYIVVVVLLRFSIGFAESLSLFENSISDFGAPCLGTLRPASPLDAVLLVHLNPRSILNDL